MHASTSMRARSAEKVLSDHRAAIGEGNIERDVDCNYADDAIVISDAGVDRGRAAIRQRLQQLTTLFGSVVPEVIEQTIVQLDDTTSLARVLFRLTTPDIEIADGVDTYIVKNGQIHWQSAHGRPTFPTRSAVLRRTTQSS